MKLDLDETLIWETLAAKRTVLSQSWRQSFLGASFLLVLHLVLEVVPLVWEVCLDERLLVPRADLVVVGLVVGGDSRSGVERQDLGERLPLKSN